VHGHNIIPHVASSILCPRAKLPFACNNRNMLDRSYQLRDGTGVGVEPRRSNEESRIQFDPIILSSKFAELKKDPEGLLYRLMDSEPIALSHE
jgi:hypothetical protein